MSPTAFPADIRRNSESQVWRDFRAHRAVIGSRVAADSFSPRALYFALPMASLLWLAALSVAYPYL